MLRQSLSPYMCQSCLRGGGPPPQVRPVSLVISPEQGEQGVARPRVRRAVSHHTRGNKRVTKAGPASD